MIKNKTRIHILPILLLLVFAVAGVAGADQVHADALVWHEVNMNPGDTYDVSKAKWNTTVYIKKAGDYTLSGKSESVRVLIECGGVNLYLANGLNINCSGHSYTGSRTAAIWVKDNGGTVTLISKKNATVTLEGYMCPAIRKEGTDTKLVFATEDPNNPGTIHANSGSTDLIRNPAAIGSKEYDTGNITFNSGNVIAKIRGTNSCGAAIGGAEGNSASNITINGGHIEAYGSKDGAAIGGGAGGTFTGFYVNGGEVYAENDVTSLHFSEGAAIGGGNNTVDTDNQTPANIGAKDFYIKGGTVTAVSHGPGAAIGGGANSGCSNINIEGGTVNATNNSETTKYEWYGAGIGGGYGFEVNTEVNISGGFVTAKGGPKTPGIGSQDAAKDYHNKDKKPDKCTVRISGGTIYAGCGDGARGDIGTRDSKMIITGGNLHALSHAGDAVNGDGDAVHRVEISFDGITDDGHAISNLGFTPKDYPYGMTDVVTLSGKLHAWLPGEDGKNLTCADLDSNGSKHKYGGSIPFTAKSGTLSPGTRITLKMRSYGVSEGSAWGMPGQTSLVDMIPPTFDKKGYKLDRYVPEGKNYAVAKTDGTLVSNVTNYTDGDGKWIYSESNEVTLYGAVEAIKYKVKFDANVPKNASTQCSGSMEDESFVYDTSKTLTENKFKLPGYDFDGWYLNPEGTGQKFRDMEPIITNNRDYLAPDKDGATVTLYAKWKPKTYMITFESGEEGTPQTHQQAAIFDKPGKLDPVERFEWSIPSGYGLHGWAGQGFGSFYDDGEDFINLCQMDNGEPVLNDDGTIKGKTLIAEWVETEKIKVSITKDGVPQAGLKDYLFLVKQKQGEEPLVYCNMFLQTGSGSNITYLYDPGSSNPIPDGTYELWFDTKNPPDNIEEGPGEYLADSVDISYGGEYAVSTVFDYYTVGIKADPAYGGINSVSISDAGGVLKPSPDKKIFAPDGHKLNIQTTTKAGYHFDGYSAIGVAPIWENNNPGNAIQTIEVQGTADIMAHGAPNTYKVHFDGNGSSVEGTMPDQDMVYGEPQNLFANQFKRVGGTFFVWATNKDGGGNIYEDAVSVENLTTENGGTVTLFAQWAMTTFDIDYDLNCGKLSSGKTNPDRYWADSATFTLNNPVKTDYDFTGWMGTGLKGPTKKVTIKEGSVGDRAYIATWAIKQYTVVFKDNGGTGVEEQLVQIHKKVKKPKNPTRKGYTFQGWYTDKTLKKAYDFNQEVTKDMTLYAKWKLKPTPVLLAKVTAKGKKSMTISWNKVNGAKGYDIYFAKCNGKDNTKGMKKVKTVKAGKKLKWTKKGLKKKTAYKAYVKAYTIKDGKKKYIKTSPLTHVYTSGASKKYSNAKALTVNKKKVTLNTGKSFKIKAKVTKVKKFKKLMPATHVPTLRYLSSNKKVATVTKSGTIKAKAKGTCYVYVYTHNGISKKIAVTVK